MQPNKRDLAQSNLTFSDPLARDATIYLPVDIALANQIVLLPSRSASLNRYRTWPVHYNRMRGVFYVVPGMLQGGVFGLGKNKDMNELE